MLARVAGALLLVVGMVVPKLAFGAEGLHEPWDKLLKTYVSDGEVDYQGLKKKSVPELDKYLASLSKIDPATLGKNDQLAYYLNLYNASVVKGVIDIFPTKSVIEPLTKNPIPSMNFFMRPRLTVGGPATSPAIKKSSTNNVSLDALENKIIRPTFKDARVHFALVCAAKGCPSLPDHAFVGKDIEHCLDHLATNFFKSKKGLRVKGATVYLSSIFNWYRDDFGTTKEAVLAFVGKYRKGLPKKARVRYLDYDWDLNNLRKKSRR